MANNLFRVYHFALPAKTNGGHDYSMQLNVWRELALDEAGGYTYLGTREGAWRGDDGKVYREDMEWFEVATDPLTKGRLMRATINLFPDQKAFYIADRGTAEVVDATDLQRIAARDPGTPWSLNPKSGLAVKQTSEPPYPFCHDKVGCAGAGYCRKDPACND